MNEIALVKTKRPDLIEGIYRLRHTVWSHTRAGKPYVRLVLEDQHNAIPAYLWNTENLRLPAELCCVQVWGRMRFRRDGVVADLHDLRAGIRRPEDIVRLIPRSLCPLPWLVPVTSTRFTSENWSTVTVAPTSRPDSPRNSRMNRWGSQPALATRSTPAAERFLDRLLSSLATCPRSARLANRRGLSSKPN